MRNKTRAIIVLSAIIVLPLLFILLDLGSANFNISIKKYRSASVGSLDFDFYGSFGSIHKVKVSNENGKICSLSVKIDAKELSECDSPVLIYTLSDTCDVLLIFSKTDDDGDVHRTPFVRSGNKYSAVDVIDMPNAALDGEKIICEESIFKYRAEPRSDYEVPYEKWAKHTEYVYAGGKLIPESALYVTYYSDTHIYCVGTWKYSEKLGALMSTDEDWLSPEKYSAVYSELEKKFKIALPEYFFGEST